MSEQEMQQRQLAFDSSHWVSRFAMAPPRLGGCQVHAPCVHRVRCLPLTGKPLHGSATHRLSIAMHLTRVSLAY